MKTLKYTCCFWWLFRWTQTLNVPQHWKDLSPKQFIAVARLYQAEYSADRFLREFYQMSRFIVNRLSTYEKYKLIELVEFVRDARIPYSEFLIHRIPRTRLYAPGRMLSGMCLQQFMTVDTYFSKYILDSSNDHYLNLFVAALYLKKNERYVASEKNTVVLNLDLRSTQVDKIDHDVKYAIFLNFIMLKCWLSRAYKHLFPEVAETQTHKSAQSTGWLSIFDAFVGDHIPDMDKYQAMPVTDAFRLMNRRIKEAKKNGNN